MEKFRYAYQDGSMEDDGPKMLWFMLTKCNPITNLNVDNLVENLKNLH